MLLRLITMIKCTGSPQERDLTHTWREPMHQIMVHAKYSGRKVD